MNEHDTGICWICREHPATERSPGTSAVLCVRCDTATRPYAAAWNTLFAYLNERWKEITKRGSFDLTSAFGRDAPVHALDTHLHFVKRLGCQLSAGKINVDLTSFAQALLRRTAHPEITLLIADCAIERGKPLYYDADVSVLRRDDEVHSAVWMSLSIPVAVKTCYLRSSAPVNEPEGHPWHPARQRKIVKLSPYKGDTRPMHARRDLRL